jgi:hypothetical protein
MALPRLAVSGRVSGERPIFLLCLVPLFFLGVLLLFHPLISLSPHFFEVFGFRITRVPSQPLWCFHDLPSPLAMGQAWPEEEVPWRLPIRRSLLLHARLVSGNEPSAAIRKPFCSWPRAAVC